MAGEVLSLDRSEAPIPVVIGSEKGAQGDGKESSGSPSLGGSAAGRVVVALSRSGDAIGGGGGSRGLDDSLEKAAQGGEAMILGGGNGGGGSSGLSGRAGKGGAGGLGGGRRSVVLVVGLLDPGGGGLWWWEEVEEKELLGLGGQDGLGLGGLGKRRLRKKVLVEKERVRGEVAGGREEDEVGSRRKRTVTEDTEESGSQKGVRGLFPDPIME